MGAKRPRAELVKLLAEQRQALAVSCESYDKGNEWEATRLATTIFTLVHDGGSITSLLTQLELRESVPFISSGRDENDEFTVLASPALIRIQVNVGGQTKYQARLDETRPGLIRELPFKTWWSDECIFKDYPAKTLALNRARLVFTLRHQDGGGHVGRITDPAYANLKDGGPFTLHRGDGSAEPLPGGVSATMRQVAWEVTRTLEKLGEVT